MSWEAKGTLLGLLGFVLLALGGGMAYVATLTWDTDIHGMSSWFGPVSALFTIGGGLSVAGGVAAMMGVKI